MDLNYPIAYQTLRCSRGVGNFGVIWLANESRERGGCGRIDRLGKPGWI